jgi:hypothetical protein
MNRSFALPTVFMMPPYFPFRSSTTGSSGMRSLSDGSLPALTMSASIGASDRLAGTLSSRYDFGGGAAAGFAASAGFAAAAGAAVAAGAGAAGFGASAAGFAASAGFGASTVRGVSTGFGAAGGVGWPQAANRATLTALRPAPARNERRLWRPVVTVNPSLSCEV